MNDTDVQSVNDYAERVAYMAANPRLFQALYERVCALLAKHDSERFYRPQLAVREALTAQRRSVRFDNE
jgi:hypothetical protein